MIDNFSSELLKVLSADTSELVDSARKFILDQILNGEVLQVFPDGKAQIKLGGQTVIAAPQHPLVAGQTLTAKVEQVTPATVLRLLETNPGDGTTITLNTVNRRGNPVPIATPTSAEQKGDQTTISRNFTGQRIDLATLSRDLLDQTSDPETASHVSLIQQEPVGEGELLTKSVFQSLNIPTGREVSGTVSRVIDNTTIMIQINDKQLPVKVFPQSVLSPGDVVTARVEQIADRYVLVVQAQKEAVPQLRTVEPSMIKPYLVARQPFGEMIENLQKVLIDSPVLKELKLDPEFLGRIKESLSLLFAKDNPLPDEMTLKSQVAQSGVNYEAKVRRLFAGTPEIIIHAGKASLAGDLKGQLLKLGKDVEAAIARSDWALPQNPRNHEVSAVLQSIKQATDNIELNQLTNQYAKQEHQPIVLQIPYLPSSDGKTVKLYVKSGGGDGKKNQGDKQTVSLVFLLNMTALGHLRVDTQVTKDQLSIKIGADNQAVTDFIQTHTEELKARLREAGFTADVSCRQQKIEEMQVEEGLTRFLVKDPSRLVDVKT